jgi:hypothetical protein
MDALTYLKEKRRMTKNCNISCHDCNIYLNLCDIKSEDGCTIYEFNNPEKAIEIVEKWAKENPIKTYKSVFFENFPNAQRTGDNYPIPNVRAIFGGTAKPNGSWHQEWDEEFQDPRP